MLVDMREACKFWGGSKPVNPATIYRMIANGCHPKPVKFGSLSRFLKSELIAERERRCTQRDGVAA